MNISDEESGKLELSSIADIYERLYYQFVDLMNFSYKLAGSYRKSDAVAAIISEEVSKIDGVTNNAVWIVTEPKTVVKMAQNGNMIPRRDRKGFDFSSIHELGLLIRRQKVRWGPFDAKTREVLAGFRSPMLFPIRGIEFAQGFLVVDHDEEVDTERCQYITKFSSMILEMSSLYFRLEDEIRERQILEDLLIEEKNKAQSYLDVAEVMLIALDTHGNVDLINRKGCQILGYASDEVVGKNWFEQFVDQGDRAEQRSLFSSIIEHDAEYGKFVESSIINSSGDRRTIAWHNTRVIDEDGNIRGTISCGSDITDQKRSEMEKQAIQTQLFQAQKMEAIGTLVGGIAHDFNNMLQAIIGYSELLSEDIGSGNPGHKEVETVINTARGGADLVKKLLVFGQQALAFPVEFDLNRQISDLGILLSRTLPNEVDVVFDLSGSPAIIYADPNQIDQSIMNIAINASEAMPDGGTIRIRTTEVFLNEDFCRPSTALEPGKHVMLTISDTGKGMDQKTLSRIYEPFFSTKQRGSARGTGLGLSVVKGIIDKQGGDITCESQPGKGTTFSIYFKAVDQSSKFTIN